MAWLIFGHLFTTLLDWISIGRLSSGEKDLEILVRANLDIRSLFRAQHIDVAKGHFAQKLTADASRVIFIIRNPTRTQRVFCWPSLVPNGAYPLKKNHFGRI